MNKQHLLNDFTEIVAIRLDAFDQRYQGIWPPHTDLQRWKDRYRGIPKEALPPFTIEINHFKIEVDEFVAMLIRAVEMAENE